MGSNLNRDCAVRSSGHFVTRTFDKFSQGCAHRICIESRKGWLPRRGKKGRLPFQNALLSSYSALQAAEDCLSTSKYFENGYPTGVKHR
jgi:hypothetical protein